MIKSIYNPFDYVPANTWVDLFLGIFLVSLGGMIIYHGLKTIITNSSSTIPNSDDLKSVGMGRRILAWVVALVALLGGLFTLYTAFLTIYLCAIERDPTVIC